MSNNYDTSIDPLIPRRKVCEALAISPERLRRLIRDGKLRAIKLGPRSTRIRRSDFEAFVQRLEATKTETGTAMDGADRET